MKSFEDYLNEGIIKKIKPDKNRAESLIKEAERKLKSLNERIEKISIRNDNANDYIESCYDIIMFLIRSNLFLQGYSSLGQGAHEAEISFMESLGFSQKDINFTDKLRYFRNGMLYYGKSFDKDYAEKVVDFLNKIYPLLKNEISKTQLEKNNKEIK